MHEQLKSQGLVLDLDYSIHLAAGYNVGTPIYANDIFGILLFFNELVTIKELNKKEFEGIINIDIYPEIALLDKDLWRDELDLVNNTRLALINYAVKEAKYLWIRSYNKSDREKFVQFVTKYNGPFLGTIKQSFLLRDILDYIIEKNLPTIRPKFTPDFLKSLQKFKKSKYSSSFNRGIIELLSKFDGYYIVDGEMENYIDDYIVECQVKFLNLIKADKLGKFDWGAPIGDVISAIPFVGMVPLSTLMAFYKYLSEVNCADKEQILFALSLYILQKSISKEIPFEKEYKKCHMCRLTIAEIENMEEDEFVPIGDMCMNHMVAYLNGRKLHQLIGKELYIFIKCGNSMVD